MSGHTSGPSGTLYDYTTGALVGQIANDGVEYALPGARADHSGTPGAATQHTTMGRVSIAPGASSVVVTNSNVTANSAIFAVVSQAAADATLLRVERVVPALGSFTIYGTANATAATRVDWVMFGQLKP